MSRLGNDIATVYSVCSDNFSMLVRNFLQLIGSIVLLWFISWKLTLAIVLLIPVISFLVLFIIKKMKEIQKKYSDGVAQTSSLAN